MGKIREGKLLYHLTQLSNLDSIISHGLVPRSVLEQHGAFFSDVADSEIMRKRKAFLLILCHGSTYEKRLIEVDGLSDEGLNEQKTINHPEGRLMVLLKCC